MAYIELLTYKEEKKDRVVNDASSGDFFICDFLHLFISISRCVFLRCVLTSLYESMSVRWFVSWLVLWLIGQ